MQIGISVGQSVEQFLGDVDEFQRARVRRAISMALNRTLDGIRVDASREIRARYKLKVATVNKAFSMQRATPGSLTGIVRVRGMPLNLANFQPRQTRKGVSVNVKGTRKLIPHAFIVNVPTRDGEGTVGVVFIREDPKTHAPTKRLPIRPLTSVDVPGLFMLKDLQVVVKSSGLDRFRTELGYALNVK